MHAMVLAAGLGTRLRPLTDELPKPAVPVLNRPLATATIEHLARSGAESVTFNTHHLADELRASLEPQVPGGVIARFVHEPVILGTGGGIRNAWLAAGQPDPFVVMNGDVLFAPDLVEALKRHVQLDAIATMVLRTVEDPERYGAVEIDSDARVRRLLGAPGDGAGLRKLMFSGAHILSARAVASLPEQGCVVRQGYRKWIDSGEVVAGFVDDTSWLELGTPNDYATAQLELLRSHAGLSGTRPGSLIDPTAAVDQAASLHNCVVGAGCQVIGAVSLQRVIAWPGARIDRDLSDVIVTSAGRQVAWIP